jgi:hypothetical protein
MGQSRVLPLVEVVTGSVIAFALSILALFGFPVRLEQSFAITLIFTVISIVRGYLVRRFFEVYLRPFLAWCQKILRALTW